MRIALLQYPIVWADKEANLYLLRERLTQIKGQADIAVVPEMFTTGFCTGNPELAEEWGSETCQVLQAMADEYGIAIVGSMIASVNQAREDTSDQPLELNGLRNRGFMFRPNDRPLYQDKRHLYRTGGEARFFEPAEQIENWEYKGVKIRMLVCYDLRFPIWARQPQGIDNMYDLLLVVGNWPEVRIQYWDALIAARATENQCYIVAVNNVGDDGLGWHYNGHSKAYDTYLRELAQFKDNEQGTRIVNLDMNRLHHFREALPLWQDADRYQILT